MTTIRRLTGWILLGMILLPVVVLVVWTLRLSASSVPERFTWAGGETVLALRLVGPTKEDRSVRVLRSDGVVDTLSGWELAVPDTAVWMVWRDDAPPLLGRLVGVVVAPGDTLRGKEAATALSEMPDPLAEDERRLVSLARGASQAGDSVEAADRLRLFRSHHSRVAALLESPGTGVFGVPVVRIRHVEEFAGGWTGALSRSISRLWFQIRSSPDLGSGGGLRSAVVASSLVVMLAGLLGGIPALLLAVYLADQLEPGPAVRWLRWASEGLSGVPGVVWGAVCAALLASQGNSLLAIFGGSFTVVGGVFWAGLTLGILSAPVTFSRAMDAIDRVPRSSREIARSCGASRYQVLFYVVLPACKRGLRGAWLSGLARAGGETAPLLLVGAAGGLGTSWDLSSPVPALTGDFLHLGAMAYLLPWPTVEADLGHPLAFLALTLVAAGCLALEWGALWSEDAPR